VLNCPYNLLDNEAAFLDLSQERQPPPRRFPACLVRVLTRLFEFEHTPQNTSQTPKHPPLILFDLLEKSSSSISTVSPELQLNPEPVIDVDVLTL